MIGKTILHYRILEKLGAGNSEQMKIFKKEAYGAEKTRKEKAGGSTLMVKSPP